MTMSGKNYTINYNDNNVEFENTNGEKFNANYTDIKGFGISELIIKGAIRYSDFSAEYIYWYLTTNNNKVIFDEMEFNRNEFEEFKSNIIKKCKFDKEYIVPLAIKYSYPKIYKNIFVGMILLFIISIIMIIITKEGTLHFASMGLMATLFAAIGYSAVLFLNNKKIKTKVLSDGNLKVENEYVKFGNNIKNLYATLQQISSCSTLITIVSFNDIVQNLTDKNYGFPSGYRLTFVDEDNKKYKIVVMHNFNYIENNKYEIVVNKNEVIDIKPKIN
ncbi:MAG: hypothetical protein PHY26_03930 [Bacilli bacterium]|nr:hypothetical protein [Bacilli bacterium]